MRVRYVGPSPAVEIPLPSGQWLLCERGGEIDVPDEIGADLTRQDVWQAADAKPAKPPKGE